MARYCTASFWTKGQPATGLTPTIRIRDVSTGELIVTDETMFEVGDGGYAYLFTAFDPTKYYQVRCDAGSEIVNQYSIGWSFPDSDDNVTTIAGKIIGTLLAGNHNPQGGDSFARIGANGAGLTAIGDSRLEYLDASILSRLATAGYTSPDNAGITAIKAKTDRLPNNPASEENVTSRLATADYEAPDNAGITAIRNKTDNLPASPASEENVTSRLAAVNYEAPNNSGITAIGLIVSAMKLVTDKIDTMLEIHDLLYRFTAAALANASGGGGTATIENQIDMIDKLKGIMSKNYSLATPVGTYDPATDSGEAIRDRGDAAWTKNLVGSNTVAISVIDGTNPIADVSVQVLNSSMTILLDMKLTDALGVAGFTLDNGSYKVRLRKSSWSFAVSYDLTVNGNTSVEYAGTALVIPSPSIPGHCRCYDICYSQDGETPLPSVTARATIVSLPFDSGDVLHTGDTVAGTYNPSTGVVYFDVIFGASVRFEIEEMGVFEIKVVPAQSTARITDMANA